MATRNSKFAKTHAVAAAGLSAPSALADVISQAAMLQLQLAKLYQSLLELQQGNVSSGDGSQGSQQTTPIA